MITPASGPDYQLDRYAIPCRNRSSIRSRRLSCSKRFDPDSWSVGVWIHREEALVNGRTFANGSARRRSDHAASLPTPGDSTRVQLRTVALAIGWVLAACGKGNNSTPAGGNGGATSTSATTSTTSTSVAGAPTKTAPPSASPSIAAVSTGLSGGTPQNGGDFTVLLDTTGETYDFDPHSYYNINTVLFQGPYEQLDGAERE